MERLKKIDAYINSKKIVFVCERPKETGHIKGLDIAINTFKIVKKKIVDAELLLIGSGESAKAM